MNVADFALGSVGNAATQPAGTLAARTRILLTYGWRHGRLPDLDNPATFTELVQVRKLSDHDQRMPRLADKVAVKGHVAALLGDDWVIPTLWHGRVLPVVPQWPLPLVVKSRHGCNQRAFVRYDARNWPKIRFQTRRWMASSYGYWLDEWLYSGIQPGILVEPFVGVDGQLPVDYKLYVFGGRVEFVQVHLGREHRHRWIILDGNWRRVSSPTADPDPPRPHSLPDMIAAAEQLGNGFDFVRIDFYEVAGRPLFGEMTFYPGSGLDPFDPVEIDVEMGRLWRAARQESRL